VRRPSKFFGWRFCRQTQPLLRFLLFRPHIADIDLPVLWGCEDELRPGAVQNAVADSIIVRRHSDMRRVVKGRVGKHRDRPLRRMEGFFDLGKSRRGCDALSMCGEDLLAVRREINARDYGAGVVFARA